MTFLSLSLIKTYKAIGRIYNSIRALKIKNPQQSYIKYYTNDILRLGNVLIYSTNIGVRLVRHSSGFATISTLTNSLTYDCDFRS